MSYDCRTKYTLRPCFYLSTQVLEEITSSSVFKTIWFMFVDCHNSARANRKQEISLTYCKGRKHAMHRFIEALFGRDGSNQLLWLHIYLGIIKKSSWVSCLSEGIYIFITSTEKNDLIIFNKTLWAALFLCTFEYHWIFPSLSWDPCM